MRLTIQQKKCIVDGIMDDVPSEKYLDKLEAWLNERAHEQLIEPLRTLVESNPDVKNYLDRKVLYHCCAMYVTNSQFVETEEIKAHIAEVLALHEIERESRITLRKELRGLISSVNTDKQLVDRYPEFTKYLPVEMQRTANLPATQVLTDLIRAGWPKSDKDAQIGTIDK